MHVLIAPNGGEYRYAAWHREHPTVGWSIFTSGNRLEPVVDQALAFMLRPNVAADFSFSTRPAEEIMADMIETPDQLLTGANGCDIEVLCREGRLESPDDRWATVHRFPNCIDMLSGPNFLFRSHTLRQQIQLWFDSRGWASFGPPRPHRGDPLPPPWARELYVRHGDGWRARLMCPDSFPAFRAGPVVSDEQAARRISRMPQTKSAVRRAKHQENLERFRAEAAGRAKQREEATAE